MTSFIHGSPPLSPVLPANIVLGPLPPVVLQPVLDVAMAIIGRRHPGLFDRLAGLAECTVLIDPIDLPFGFVLRPSPPPSLVAVAKDRQTETPTATIRGPLSTLIRLLEGKLDGDALFFSRDLVVEGDTEALVTLRNAIDDASIDVLDDLLSVLGPLAGPAGRMVGGAATILARLDRDVEMVRRAVLAPVTNRHEALAAELHELREQVAELRGQRDSGLGARRSGRAGTRDI